jgi:hypothetical protein
VGNVARAAFLRPRSAQGISTVTFNRICLLAGIIILVATMLADQLGAFA